MRAGEFRPPAPPILSALDANADGEISADEIENAVAALRNLDKDNNGEVASDELMPFGPGMGGPGGPMTRPRLEILEKFDVNKDGILRASERAEARKYAKDNRPAGGGPGFGGPGFGGPGFGGPGFGGPGFGGPGFGGPPDDGMGFGPGFGGPPDDGMGFGPGFGGPPDDGMGFGPGFGGPPDDGMGFGPGFGGPGFGGPGFGGPGFGGPGFGGPPGGGPFADRPTATPGKRLTPADVTSHPDRDLFDPDIIRTVFLQFENQDWEEELEDFRMTDVDVPAQMIVDGKTYDDVGVRFRGNTSYQMIPRGSKRPLNLSVDYGKKDQRLQGRRTLNLLNASSDPSFLRSFLFSLISRQYLPALSANFVRVVINGENWGIYTHEEQFNKDFLRQWFGDSNGARWKVPPNFSGGSGLKYLGEDLAPYKRNYVIKSPDNETDWRKLVQLCRALQDTPSEERESEFDKLLNVDQVLWFLAVDNVLVDGDGYFTRASDYTIYLDTRYDRFYLFAHDNNESLRDPEGPGPGGPGGRGAPGEGSGELDPLSQVGSSNRPLLTALLANPAWKARYLAHVRTIAEQWLDWNTLGPVVTQYQALIDNDVREDTKKLTSYEQFAQSVESSDGGGRGPFGPPPGLKTFAQRRREYLLNHAELNKPTPTIASVAHRGLDSSRQKNVTGRNVLIEARIAGDPKPQTVLLYHADMPGAPFLQIEMSDDGQQHDQLAGDGTYSAVIAGTAGKREVRYYVEARADANIGTTTFMPSEAEMGAYRCEATAMSDRDSAVVINEIMATNKRSVQDPQGQYDDWLELYNRSDRTVDVSGMYLSDSETELLKWSFPPGTTIRPRGTLVVWLDDDLRATRGLHANFKLSQNGETVFLSDTDLRGNAICDKFTFGAFKEEVTFGRFPDGGARCQPLVPTPDAANRASE